MASQPTSFQETMNATGVDSQSHAGAGALQAIRDQVSQRHKFLLTSHARPDGDSIGSQLAMAFALDTLGKQVRIINADAAPEHYLEFPGVDRIHFIGGIFPEMNNDIIL